MAAPVASTSAAAGRPRGLQGGSGPPLKYDQLEDRHKKALRVRPLYKSYVKSLPKNVCTTFVISNNVTLPQVFTKDEIVNIIMELVTEREGKRATRARAPPRYYWNEEEGDEDIGGAAYQPPAQQPGNQVVQQAGGAAYQAAQQAMYRPQQHAVGAAVNPPVQQAGGAAYQAAQKAMYPPQQYAVGAAVNLPVQQAGGAAYQAAQKAMYPPQQQVVGAAVNPPVQQAGGAAYQAAQKAMYPPQQQAVGAAVNPPVQQAGGAAYQAAQQGRPMYPPQQAVGAPVYAPVQQAGGAVYLQAQQPANQQGGGPAYQQWSNMLFWTTELQGNQSVAQGQQTGGLGGVVPATSSAITQGTSQQQAGDADSDTEDTGCDALYLANGTDHEEFDLPSCTCRVTLKTLTKHVKLSRDSMSMLHKLLQEPVSRIAEKLTAFGQDTVLQNTGCRTTLLVYLRDLLVEQAMFSPNFQPASADDFLALMPSYPPHKKARKSVVPSKPSDLITLTEDDEDYQEVRSMMLKSIMTHAGVPTAKYKIKEIQRVWNEKLFLRYCRHLEVIKEENGGDTNERHLFHGSPLAPMIAEKGFDERFASMHGMFGAGLYFAEHSSKSNNYVFGLNAGCKPHNNVMCQQCKRYMLVCRVALGKVSNQNRAISLAHPPPGCHAVKGLPTTEGGSLVYPEYIVYRGEQAFPEFLITYKLWQ